MLGQAPLTARRTFMFFGRTVLGGVFIYAAYSKLRLPWGFFALSINSYRLLPESAVILLARTLPWLELALGVLLLVGYRLRYVAAAASSLLMLFFAVMLRSYFQGLAIDCGCFGLGETLSARTLARDMLLLVVSISVTIAAFLASPPRASAQQSLE